MPSFHLAFARAFLLKRVGVARLGLVVSTSPYPLLIRKGCATTRMCRVQDRAVSTLEAQAPSLFSVGKPERGLPSFSSVADSFSSLRVR
jgi:hypothetical protein